MTLKVSTATETVYTGRSASSLATASFTCYFVEKIVILI